MKSLIASAILLFAAPLTAQPTTDRSSRETSVSSPIVVESYYRVKWGSEAEFKELYNRNEAPLLREMQRKGFIMNVVFEEPFTPRFRSLDRPHEDHISRRIRGG